MSDVNPIEVQRALKGASYPTDRQTLTDLAKKNKASDNVVDRISHMKTDRIEGPDQVEKEMFRG
ncbi:DUF2795 domain-containing protein [Streptomyces diacarni]|uniref:DUF2795 domain-containing protein n=1 Tax=Streptomyces diacarni TaxID=2800381 RepID=A0A367F6Q1_9ACTN|nr:DUF2795 domain-containing protein [Streptomyces diacarni]RCG26038.1 DUF2795 domain-containing protein [Streptomyces diacarni]